MRGSRTRRAVLRAAVASGLALSGPGEMPVATAERSRADGRWPQLGHDAAHSGASPDEPAPTDGAAKRWGFVTLEEPGRPVVADGSVYLSDGSGRLYAVDTGGGSERWRFEAGGGVNGTPAVVGDTVYVGTDTGAVALATGDGRVRWRHDTEQGVRTPTVADGTVYVPDRQDALHALAAADGSERWRVRTGGDVELTVATPGVLDGTVYLVHEAVAALDGADGSERWRSGLDLRGASAPAVVHGSVYVVGDASTLYALDAADGRERWRFQPGGDLYGPPAEAHGTVYVGGDGGMFAVAATDGAERWRADTGDSVVASPAVAAETVYVGSRESVHALDAADGSERWRFADPSDEKPPWADWSAAAVADGTVYVPNDGYTLYALSSPTPTPPPTTTEAADHVVRMTDDLAFTPATVRIEPGDTVVWRNDSSTVHTVTAYGDALPDGADYWASGGFDAEADARTGFDEGAVEPGETYEHTFETAGVHEYFCVPHEEAGMIGEVVVGGEDPEPTPEDTPDDDGDAGLLPVAVGGGALGALALGGLAWLLRGDGDAGGRRDHGEPPAGVAGSSDEGGDDGPDGGDVPQGGVSTPGAQDPSSEAAPDLRESLEDLRVALEEVSEGADAGAFEDLAAEAEDIAAEARERGHEAVAGDVEALAGRCEDRAAAARRRSMEPSSVPRAPDLSLRYDDLERGERIGRGGNADVYRATVARAGQAHELAVKEPRFRGTMHAETVERFQSEAETWSKLDGHDHVVGVVDYGTEPMPWIAMEYMDGGDLRARLDASGVGLEEGLWVARGVTEAIIHARDRGVAHLDLKPGNVLFRSVEDGWDVPKVGDWGLAQLLLEHSRSMEGLTVEYAAPEQVEDAASVGHHTDVYQLGAVCYELFVGEPPFTGAPAAVVDKVSSEPPIPPTEVNSELPAALDDVLLTALAKDPADRQDHPLYVRDALDDIREEL